MMRDRFLRYLTYEKRYSSHTILAYRNDLEQFFRYLAERYEWDEARAVEPMHIRSWMAELIARGVAPRSVRRKLSTLRAYFRFSRQQGYMTDSPMSKVKMPKTGKRLPSAIPMADLEALFQRVEFSDDFAGRRDRLLLELLYATGMRRAEALNLTWQAIDFSRGLVKVFGKGAKERLIPLSGALRERLAAYRVWREREFSEAACPQVLLNDKGKPLSPRAAYDIVYRYLSLVTVVERRGPHALRHSFAMHLADNGAGISVIKDLLGHASLASTQIYARHSLEKLREAYLNAHPKATSRD
jgi:integrase/recombinase XerC